MEEGPLLIIPRPESVRPELVEGIQRQRILSDVLPQRDKAEG